MYPKRLIILIFLLFLAVCEWPFDTQPTLEDPIFEVTTELSDRYFIDSAFVTLAWPSIGFDNFTALKISRRYAQPRDSLQAEWVPRTTITNQYTSTWQDTIYDDEDLRYRITVYQIEGPYGSSDVVVEVPPTTHLIVPTQIGIVALAVGSLIIDDGDTVLVRSGKHPTPPVDFQDRAIYLLSTGGAAKTTLIPAITDTTTWSYKPLVTMSGGLLRGFTIAQGKAIHGAGVFASDFSVIRQCVFRENLAVHTHSGKGGGLYLTGSTRIENCIIHSNVSVSIGGGIYVGGGLYVDIPPKDVRIINCTIYGNTAYLKGGGIACSGGNVTVENCIVVPNDNNAGIYPRPSYLGAPLVIFSNAGDEWRLHEPTNIAGDPLFLSPHTGNFHLQDDSPCIDAGNPAPAFNDPDDTRNDMGAFGGPYGNWEAPGPQLY